MIRVELNNQTKHRTGSAWLQEAVRAVNNVLKYKKKYLVSVALVGSKRMATFNKKYRRKTGATDVLSFSELEKGSFPLGGGAKSAGEIIICPDVAKKNAREAGHRLTREMQELFIHGLLHIFGYEHNTAEKEKKMLRLQKKILKEI